MSQTSALLENRCPTCNCAVDCEHAYSCDVPQCPLCGKQAQKCKCDLAFAFKLYGFPKWTGVWPGNTEAEEYGFYCKFSVVNGEIVSCEADDPNAIPDSFRVHRECEWSVDDQRFYLRTLDSR